jgi:hypothetical protein
LGANCCSVTAVSLIIILLEDEKGKKKEEEEWIKRIIGDVMRVG